MAPASSTFYVLELYLYKKEIRPQFRSIKIQKFMSFTLDRIQRYVSLTTWESNDDKP